MTICSVTNCQNSSNKGVKMCYFPSNPEERTKWVTNVGRKDWLPNKCSALCEYHFVPDDFEKLRVDGTKKLKRHAVPTIFGELVTQIPSKWKKRKTDSECRSEETNAAIQCMRKESSVPARKGQKLDSMDKVGEIQIPAKKQIMISVLKPVNVTEKCTEENPDFRETNTSTMTAVVNICTEENSNVEKEASAAALERTCTNDNTKVTKLITKCKKLEQLYKQSETSKIKMKRTFKQKEMALKRRIKTLEEQARRTTAKKLWMRQLQTWI